MAPRFITDADWAAVVDAIRRAADSVSDVVISLSHSPVAAMEPDHDDVPLVEFLTEGGGNFLNTAFHEAIVATLDLDGIGARNQVQGPAKHDIDIWGYRGEIKTAMGPTVVTNASYLNMTDEPRLVIVTNFYIHAGRIRVYLVRYGMIGPSDYARNSASGSQQRAHLTREAMTRLFAAGDWDTEQFPAGMVRGVGRRVLETFGNPITVHDLRRAVMAAGPSRYAVPDGLLANMQPERVAEQLNWFTYGAPRNFYLLRQDDERRRA